MKRLHPLAETYIQNLREDNDHNAEPVSDQYFLGRLDLNYGVRDSVFQKQHHGFLHRVVNRVSSALEYKFLPQGFAQMVLLDPNFQSNNYRFTFVRREFIGERAASLSMSNLKKKLRKDCLPEESGSKIATSVLSASTGPIGRADYTHYLHFDSWRFNLQGDVWLPSYIYVEESGTKRSSALFHDSNT